VVEHLFREFVSVMRFDGAGCVPGAIVAESVAGLNVDLQPISRGERTKDLAAAVRLFAPRLVSDTLRLLVAAFQGQLRRLAYLGPLRSFPPRHLAFGEANDANWVAGGGVMWDVVKRDAGVRERVNAWLSDAQRLSTPFELGLQRHVATSQLAPLLERAFDAVEIEPPEREDGLVTMVSGAELLIEVPKDLQEKAATGEISGAEYQRLLRELAAREQATAKVQDTSELKYHHTDTAKAAANTVELIHKELATIDDVELVDKRTNTRVSHRDVGIGISQVLPVLVHAHADRGRIVAIEQPEIHLHPALQADLGDLFIESALGERQNTFLLETHSEHLILRILRRVRETTAGTLPEGFQPVRPEDVSVLYVQPGPNGSEVIELPVTPDGDFGRPWPGGFFAERFEDLP
jgi:hypothetical protein